MARYVIRRMMHAPPCSARMCRALLCSERRSQHGPAAASHARRRCHSTQRAGRAASACGWTCRRRRGRGCRGCAGGWAAAPPRLPPTPVCPPPPPLLAAPVCTIATRHFHSLPMHVSGGHMSTLRWVRLSAHCPVSQSQRSWASQWRGRGGADSAWRGCAGVLSRARGAPSLRGVKTGTASAVGGCTAAPGLFVSPCWRMT